MTPEDLAHSRVLLDEFINRREEPDVFYVASLGKCARCKGDTRYMAITYCDTCELALLHLLREHLNAETTGTVKTVAVNGHWQTTTLDELSYEEIVALAGKNEDTQYTVTYFCRLAGDLERKGTLLPGEKVKLGPRTIIDCMFTGFA